MTDFDITNADTFLSAEVMESLRSVIDPELNINIVDLGLVYRADASEADKTITADMTLSTRYCPMGNAILAAAENCLKQHYKEYSIQVNLVWEPQWTPDRITPEGLKQLGR